MPFALTPVATAAADAAAALTARGASPELMTDANDSFLAFSTYITPTPGVGPNGEVGFPEEDAEVLTLNLLSTTNTLDDNGDEVGTFTHALKCDALERIWRRAEADGFDTSPAATKGSALLRLRDWIDEIDPKHADYEAQPTDWYRLEARSAGGAAHWMYDVKLSDCVGADGRARLASVLLSYIRGRALAAPRHTGGGTVLPVLEAMWTETRASGVAMTGAAAGAARAQAVLGWLADSGLDPLLAEFTLPRLGSAARVLMTEVEHRAIMHHGSPEQRMRVALHVLPRILAAGKLGNLGEVIDPVPSPVLLSQLLDRLGAVLIGRQASFRLTHWDEVKRLDALLGAPGLLETVRAEVARLSSATHARVDAAKKVDILEAEMASAAAAARAAPRQSSTSGGGSGEAGGGEGGGVGTLVQSVYDVSQTERLFAGLRTTERRKWLHQLDELATPSGGEEADPHRILSHLMTSDVLAVRRFAVGRVSSLPHPSFQARAVSAAPKRFAEYLAEAVLTDDDGKVAAQRGKPLVLPPEMVHAVQRGQWHEVDFERLTLLVLAALEPLTFSTTISKSEAWTSVVRKDYLLLYGGRLVAAGGGGRVTESNSFGTMVKEWAAYLGQVPLGGKVGADQVANAKTFVADSLVLAARFFQAAYGDTNPLGALPASFLPAGAKPFEVLDTHAAARSDVTRLVHSFPAVAASLGVSTGVLPPGVSAEHAAPGPAPALAPAAAGALRGKGEDDGAGVERKRKTAEAAKTRKEKLKKLKADAAAKGCKRDGNLLTWHNGSSATTGELAAIAEVDEDSLCWETVAAPGPPEARYKCCPTPAAPGHRGKNDVKHRRGEGFGAKLQAHFQGQRRAA